MRLQRCLRLPGFRIRCADVGVGSRQVILKPVTPGSASASRCWIALPCCTPPAPPAGLQSAPARSRCVLNTRKSLLELVDVGSASTRFARASRHRSRERSASSNWPVLEYSRPRRLSAVARSARFTATPVGNPPRRSVRPPPRMRPRPRPSCRFLPAVHRPPASCVPPRPATRRQPLAPPAMAWRYLEHLLVRRQRRLRAADFRRQLGQLEVCLPERSPRCHVRHRPSGVPPACHRSRGRLQQPSRRSLNFSSLSRKSSLTPV